MSDPYEEAIELATEAQSFLTSRLGQKVMQLAGQEIDRCLQELKTINPFEAAKVAELQNTIRRNETLGGWLHEILLMGDQAKQVSADEVN